MMEDRGNSPQLPKGWVWTQVGEITVDVEKFDPRDSPDKEFIYLDIASIDNKQQKITNPKKYLGKDPPSRARQYVRSDDILFSTVRTYLKNIAIVDETYDKQIASTGFCVVRPYHPISSKLLFYLLQTDSFLNPLSQIQRGTSYPAVRDSDVFDQFIPLPPIPEQHRIVAKIEELFTKLDTGIEALKKVKAQLKRYRQAVLRYAFEGKLTEEWRKENKDKIEPASVLLEKIKDERRKYAKGKFKELPPVDTLASPELPEGWVWTRIGELFGISYGLSESLSKTKPDNEYDTPVIRIPNITQFGKLDLSELKYFPLETETKSRLLVRKGDVLFNWRNAPKWIGRSAVFDREGEFVNASFLLKLRPYIVGYSGFVAAYLNHLRISGYFLTKVANAVNQANFNANMTGQIEVPFPCLTEQHRIVEEIERYFSVADEVERTVEQSLKQAERLRQSILKKAFQGMLVPQDPSDEPAEKLLERIKQERAKRKAEDKKKKTKRRMNIKQERLI
jgi:type I restriction enzyme S subunit